MGLFDGIVGNILGSALGGGPGQNAQNPALLQSLIAMLTSGNSGGLGSLLSHLNNGGLAGAVSSWLSTGPNQAVTGEQIKGALPPDMLSQLASHAGLDPDHAAQGLSQLLPSLVDRLSPGGALPSGNGLQEALGGFAKIFSGGR